MPHRDPALARPRAHHVAGVVTLVALALSGCGAMTSDDPKAAPSAVSSSPSASPSAPATRTTTPSPTPTPTPYEMAPFQPALYDGWLTEIPDSLRVDGQLPEDGGDFIRSRHGVAFAFCDEEAFPTGDAFDRATASASGPEYGEGRDLRVFADDRAAHRFLRQIVAVVGACPEQEVSGTTWRNELRPSHLHADASATVVQSFFSQDGLPVLGGNFWEVLRVGNAVLLTASGGEYDPTTTLDPGIRDHAGDVAQIVEQMCVFAANPCAG